MKVLAQEKQQLHTVRSRKNTGSDLTAVKLRESFNGWLHAVIPPVMIGSHPKSISRVKCGIRVPSSAEFMRVSNATVREGKAHCIWPPEVLQKFQMAEVVIKSDVKHYVLSDRSIARIR